MTLPQILSRRWTLHQARILRAAIILMALVALIFLSYEFWRLLFQTGYWGAIDLLSIRRYAIDWFQGIDIYRVAKIKTYPPATQPIFWLLMGWLDVTPVRVLWAIILLLSLLYLSRVTLRAAAPDSRLERWFLALLPFCLYPFGAAIGNGQVMPLILALLVAGILGLSTGEPSLLQQLGSSALFLLALSKPTVVAPFFWIVAFALPNLMPAALVIFGYGLLTVLGASFQSSDPVTLFREWLQSNTAGSAGNLVGISDVSVLLQFFGHLDWSLPVAVFILGALGVWVWFHRQRDIWLLLGVTAVVTRFWAYHLWYDDSVLLLTMIALYRIARSPSETAGGGWVAGCLFAVTFLFMLAPGGLYLLPPPFSQIYVAVQVLVLILDLVFLILYARQATSQTIHSIDAKC